MGTLAALFPTTWAHEAELSSQPLVLRKPHEFLSNSNGLIPAHICRNLAMSLSFFFFFLLLGGWVGVSFLFHSVTTLILQVHKSTLLPCPASHLLSGCGYKQMRPLNEN